MKSLQASPNDTSHLPVRLFSGAIKLSNPCEGMKHCPELERLLRAGGGCAWRGIRWRRGVDNDDGQTRGSPPSIKA